MLKVVWGTAAATGGYGIGPLGARLRLLGLLELKKWSIRKREGEREKSRKRREIFGRKDEKIRTMKRGFSSGGREIEQRSYAISGAAPESVPRVNFVPIHHDIKKSRPIVSDKKNWLNARPLPAVGTSVVQESAMILQERSFCEYR